MKNTWIIIIILLTNCTFQGTKEELTGPEKIIAQYYEAVGGYENIKKISTLIKKGHYIEPAYHIVIPALIKKKRPDFRVIGNVEAVGFEEGYNGRAWEYHKNQGLIFSEGEAKEAIIVASEFDFPFVDAKEKGHELKYMGKSTIGGLETHNIQVIMKIAGSAYTTNFYFDIKSGLLAGQRKIMPIHARGEDVDILVTYSDYTEVEGVLVPFSQIERNRITGEFLNATIWSQLLVNRELSDAEFDPPVGDE